MGYEGDRGVKVVKLHQLKETLEVEKAIVSPQKRIVNDHTGVVLSRTPAQLLKNVPKSHDMGHEPGKGSV